MPYSDPIKQREAQHQWYLKNKEKQVANVRKWEKLTTQSNIGNIIEYLKTHPCIDCGENDIVVLEFDHVAGQKEYNISSMIYRCSWNKIKEEIEKCVVRCANCHRKRTAKQFSTYRYQYTLEAE